MPRHTKPRNAPKARPFGDGDVGYATRGIVDVTKTAAVGMIGIGILGAIGSILKK
jgi:hypothetical protein